ncbi:tape measure protein [Liquorilactobacillus hordei]|uniref:tape measure protein n=1 Tax=Liquorilactobacillus hordei TaxID=468911 RepID=UPI0039ED1D50
MADKKISATMATSIALNTLGASESIKSLTQAVNSANSAWKANESMLKSTGDYLEASKARYEGLGNTIQAQENKITALKEKQQGLNVETKEGAEAHLKYQEQIDKATTKLASLESQQARAKTAMETQKSGVVDLNVALKNQESMYTSLASKLEAEGNHIGSLKAKQDGLQDSISKQNELLSKEKEILSQVAEKSGTASSAYAKQATRVNELGTKVAETKSKLSSINDELDKSPKHGLFSGIINQLKDTSAQEEKTKERMSQFGEHVKSIVSGAAIYQGLQSLGNGLKGIAENGYEAAESATLVKERMEGVGLSEEEITSLTGQIKQLKENTNMSADSVNKLQMRFYDNTHSISAAKELTQGVASLEDQLKLTSSQSNSFSSALNRIESSGTVTLSSLGKLEKSAPGFSTAFQKASGMSTDAFDKLVSSGKMTNDQFNDILKKAAKSYNENSKTFNTTSEGAMHKLTQTWKDTQQALMTPLVNVAATGLTALSKALDNKATQSAISQLGKGIADLSTKAVGLISYLTSHAKDITSITGSILSIAKIIGGAVWSMFSGTIKTIGTMFGSMGDKASKSKDPLDQLSSAFKAIASHKTAIEDITKILITGMLGAKALSGAVSLGKNIMVGVEAFKKFRTALKDAQLAQKAFNLVANMNPFTLIISAIAIVATALYELYKHNAKFRDFINNMVKACKEFYDGAIKWFKKIGKDISKIFNDVVKWFKSNWKEVGLLIVNPIAGAFALLYKNNKGFRDFCNTLIKDAENLVKNVVNWFKSLGKGITDACSKAWKSTKKFFSDGWKDITNGAKAGAKDVGDKWNSLKSTVASHATTMWKNTKNAFSTGWKDIKNLVSDGAKTTADKFDSMRSAVTSRITTMWKTSKSLFTTGWKDTKSLVSDGENKVANTFDDMRKVTVNTVTTMWKSHKSAFKDGYKVTQDYTQTWSDVLHGKWGNVSKDLQNTTKDMANLVKNIFKSMYDEVNKLTGGRLGDVLNTFKSIFGKIKDVVSGAADGVKHAMTSVVRGVLTPFNDMLDGLRKGINWVLDKVGASTIKGSWKIDLPSYAQGTKDTHQGGLALVNDAKGSKYREMFRLPTGEVGMFPAQRDMIVPLPKGTSVLNANSSFELAQSLGLPKYANGIGSFFSGLWNKGKDLLEDADKIIAHPMEFLESIFTKFTGSISSNISLASDIITNLPKKVASNAVDWVKKLFSDDIGNIKGTATPAEAKDVIAKAMGLAGVSGDNWLNGLETIAKYESGFKNVTNNWDSNAKAGHPSSGWFQMIESTFKAYAKAGYTNWTNPMDQAISAIGYIKSRYGGIGNVPGIKSLAKGGKYVGYANGGLIDQEQIATLGEGNKKEMVIPLELQNNSRAYTLLGETVTRLAQNDSSLSNTNQVASSGIDSEVKDLKDEVTEISSMFKTLLVLMGENVTATKNIGDKKARYTQQAKDMALASYQAI